MGDPNSLARMRETVRREVDALPEWLKELYRRNRIVAEQRKEHLRNRRDDG